MKDFDTFMNDYTLHRGKRHFCLCSFTSLLLLVQKKYLNVMLKINGFKINSKKIIQIPKTGEYVRFKNYEMEKKS